MTYEEHGNDILGASLAVEVGKKKQEDNINR